MAREVLESDSVDPLSGLKGPSLFPRTIRASADVPVLADSKDLDSIHNFVKSLELRSPEKLMNEAKKIVDGGLELLESNFACSAENMGVNNVIAAKGKDRPQQRRPDLGLARKRAPFSLRTSISQPSVSLEPTLSIDHLQDPDEYFDAYERIENARKEIQKQLGGSMENLNLYKPSNNERGRRPGILGKSYKYKHLYASTPSENDDMWTLSQETVDQNIPSVRKDESQDKLVDPDPNSDADLEEVELTESMKKTESEVNNILEELLSCNDEDLEGNGALNLLQERLKIKPLDLENRYMNELHDVGRTNIPTTSESSQKRRRSSVAIGSMSKKLNRELHMEGELMANQANPLSSPTPPRSPFASVSLLQKRILQPSPLRDPFSPLHIDLPACRNTSAQLKDKLLRQADAPKDLAMSSGLESHVEVGDTEHAVSNMDANEVMGNADNEQFVDKKSTMQRHADSRPNASPVRPKDKLLGQVEAMKDLGMSPEMESNVEFGNTEPTISNKDAEEVMADEGSLPELGENASMQKQADSRPNVSPVHPKDKLHGQVDAMKDLGMSREMESNVEFANTEPTISNKDAEEVMVDAGSLPEEFVGENASMRRQADSRPNTSPVHPKDKLLGQVDALKDLGVSREIESNVEFANTEPTISNADAQEVMADAEQQHEVGAAKLRRRKRVPVEKKRIRNAHPMRKSLADSAEAGTTFENGLRRSKRIKMRPLEYWKGERFLYGRVENGLKLLGVKYISPGKGNEGLKVKPYLLSESSDYKELLYLAARH